MHSKIKRPLFEYNDYLLNDHKENIINFFDDELTKSGIDMIENELESNKIKKISNKIKNEINNISKYKKLRILLILLQFIFIFPSIFLTLVSFSKINIHNNLPNLFFISQTIMLWILFILSFVFVFIITFEHIQKNASKLINLKILEKKYHKKLVESLEKFIKKFDYSTPLKIIEQTMPILEFDNYFSHDDHCVLNDTYNLDIENNFESTLNVISGKLKENPFVIVEKLVCEFIEKNFVGEKIINYDKTFRDFFGRKKIKTKKQKLTATIKKSVPVFKVYKKLYYGNEYMPNLCFSRIPENKKVITNLKKENIKWNKKGEFKKFSNLQFDFLFKATKKSNECDFDNLFDKRVQENIIDLFCDNDNIGFNDKYVIRKKWMINEISGDSLDSLNFDSNPEQYLNYDLKKFKENFINHNLEKFKSIYFSLAPIFSVSKFQENKTIENIYNINDLKKQNYSTWQHEMLANMHDKEELSHPDSSTKNIISCKIIKNIYKFDLVEVTSHGFKKEFNFEKIKTRAENGEYFDVTIKYPNFKPVAKKRYFVVEKHKNMNSEDLVLNMKENEKWKKYFNDQKISSHQVIFYNNLLSYIIPDRKENKNLKQCVELNDW